MNAPRRMASTMVSPLTDMLKKSADIKADWGEEQDAAVAALKSALTSYPCLRQWDPTRAQAADADPSFSAPVRGA